MKFKKIQLVVVATILFSLLLAGPLVAGEKNKIHILFMEPFPANVTAAQAVIDDFQKEHPGVDINLEPLGFGGFLQKITALKAAGNPPDIIYTIPSMMWTFQSKNWLEPMDDVIADLGGDKYFQPLPGLTKRDGHYWGVPISSYSVHLEYRQDLLTKKGLKSLRTWDDLLTAAKALTEDIDNDGKIDRYGIALPLKKEYVTGVFFLSFLWGNGGHVLDKEGNVVFNSPETIETLKFMKELYQYAPPGVSGYGWMELITTYVQDKVAITGFSALKPLDDAIKANPELARNTMIGPIPTRLASQPPKARWSTMEWMVSKDSVNKELAKDFLKMWFEPERMIKYYHANPIFVVPAEYPVIESDSYWSHPLLKEYKQAIMQMIELNKSAVDSAMEHPGILQPNTAMINNNLLVAECLQNVVIGNMSPEKAAAEAHKKMEKLIARQKN